ncbi:hypothetical protein V5O48_001121 [Marasmius crinis-equi]|uniref:DNA replication checkpoint mediator MRC1 domain-containing protein n=1 Tax=Marasmius crinis-equi TaxID=585013 RepID=A0ABR3FZW2_9AGAR
MPLTKENSIIADSTISSSPSHVITPIKRPTRTYGRPRDGPSTSDAEHHRSSSSSSGSGFSRSIYRTGPPNTQEEIPPSSEPAHSSPGHRQDLIGEVEDEGSSDGDASPVRGFGLREALRAIDEKYDAEDMEKGDFHEKSSAREANQKAVLKPFPAEQRKNERTLFPPVSATPLRPSEDDVFGGSLLTLASSSQGASNPDPESNSPQVTNRKRVSRRVNTDEESDGEQDEQEKSSPAKFPINSPTARASSPTPPTSEDDMPAPKRTQKGKGKASSTRDSVPPLQFEEETSAVSDKPGGETKPQQKQRKVKALKKKELQELNKEKNRMKAERQVHIAPAEPGQDRSLRAFHGRLLASMPTPQGNAIHAVQVPAQSSPIQQFSSPRKALNPLAFKAIGDIPSRAASDSEDELPDLREVLEGTKDAKSAVPDEHKRRLREKKQQALSAAFRRDVDDDDDLEIVPTTSSSKSTSAPRRDIPMLQPRSAPMSIRKPFQAKRDLPKPAHKDVKKALMPKDVNEALYRQVRMREKAERQKREEEFLRNGGTLPEAKQEPGVNGDAMHEMLRKRLEAGPRNEGDIGEDDEEDGSDEDWDPEREEQYRGSASPEPQAGDRDSDEGDDDDMDTEPVDATLVNTLDDDADSEETPSQEEPLKLQRPRRNNARIESDSEGENDENAAPPLTFDVDATMTPVPRRGSVSSVEGVTEDEYDKENDTRRMYDRSEDKENTAVVRHAANVSRPALGSRQGSLFGLAEGLSSRLSMSPGDRILTDDENDENGPKESHRPPLRPLRSTDTLLASPSVPFFNRIQQAAPDPLSTPSGESSTSALQPALNLVRPRPNAGFSQFSEDESENVAVKPLEGGFADLFESTTQNSPSSSRGKPFGERKPLPALGLTQDVEGQTLLVVDEKLKRQADEIFEKEQGWLVERADKGQDKQPELYINDAGFLTQTRPEGTPDVYRPPPTQTQPLSRQASQALFSRRPTLSEAGFTPTVSNQRTPFRDISLTETDFEVADETPLDSPSTSPRRRRLTKRRDTLPPGDVRKLPSPPPFLESFKPKKNKAPKGNRHAKSEFVEGEAQESDEETFGFFKQKGQDDEEDGEDQDKTLENLVDDKEMDEETENVQAVMEKYQEHAEADDKELERIAQAAADGELRKKRKHGLGVDDSDDEDSENYRNEKARRKMAKVEVDRENIRQLKEDPATRAFYEVYTKAIDDDDNEVAYLVDETPADVTMGDDTVVADEDDEDRVVTRAQLMDELRQARAAQIDQGEDTPAFNPTDVSWCDEDEERTSVPTKMFSGRKGTDPRGAKRRGNEQIGFDSESQSSSFISEETKEKMQKWAATENRTRAKRGNVRSGSHTAVTGHRKIVNGGGSLRRGAASASKDSGAAARPANPVKSAPSFLNSAMDRSSRFEQ